MIAGAEGGETKNVRPPESWNAEIAYVLLMKEILNLGPPGGDIEKH